MCRMSKLPLYRLTVEENEVEGMDFVGFVDSPAHIKKYVTMSAAPVKVERYHFNEEKRIVKGVVISTYQPIYRRDDDGYEYNVYFTKEDAANILHVFAKKGYHNNVNLMHDMARKVSEVGLIEMIVVNDERSNIPTEFANQNLQKGSVIFAYKVFDDTAWKFVKENGAGFSLEGWFKNIEVKLSNHKKKKMKKSIFDMLGFKNPKATKAVFDKTKKDKYAEATTVDGQVVMWDGALESGTPIFVVPEGEEPVLAPEGELSFEFDGANYVIMVDAEGLIANVEVVEMDAEGDEELAAALVAVKKDYEGKFAAFKKESDKQLVTLATRVDELTEAVEKLGEGKPAFKKVSGSDGTPGWKKAKAKN